MLEIEWGKEFSILSIRGAVLTTPGNVLVEIRKYGTSDAVNLQGISK